MSSGPKVLQTPVQGLAIASARPGPGILERTPYKGLVQPTEYLASEERSGLRHERRNVPLAAVSAGTVKRLGIGRWDGAQTEVDEVEVRAKVSTEESNRLERRAHNLMNSEPGRL